MIISCGDKRRAQSETNTSGKRNKQPLMALYSVISEQNKKQFSFFLSASLKQTLAYRLVLFRMFLIDMFRLAPYSQLAQPPSGRLRSYCESTHRARSYYPGGHEGSAQRKPQGPARWGRVVGMHACGGPRSFMGRAGWTYVRGRCAVSNFFLSELRVLAALLSCACAFDSPFRSRKPAFRTGDGSSLQRRGPSPGG